MYNDIAPRLGFTYDVFGNTRTMLKASVGRYYGAGLAISNALSPTGQTTLSYFWNDLNGDLFVQRQEIDFARGFRAAPSANYDPSNPSAVTTLAKVDPGLTNDITDEFITGVDHELMSNFGVGFSYIYRRYHDFQDSYRDGVTSAAMRRSPSPGRAATRCARSRAIAAPTTSAPPPCQPLRRLACTTGATSITVWS